MRAILGTHKDSGQTCGACQVNCARRVSIRCIALAGTSVGWSSVILCFFLPPSCVPWLHARYALRRYYGRSDSWRAVLRALGHERRVAPDRSPCLPRLHCLPFCLQPPDGDVAAFLSFTVSFSTRSLTRCSASPATARLFPVREARAAERTSLSARRLVPPSGRIEFTLFIYDDTLLRTGSSPPAALHPVSPRRSSLRSQAGDTSA